jgi:hypothetical protein
MGVIGDSLMPIAHERTSVADEAARMNRGRSRPLWGLVAGLAALGVAAVLTMKVTSAQQQRNDAYAAVQAADQEHGEEFLRCALPGMEPGQVTNSATLLSMIEHTNQRLGPRAASRIGECLPELTVLSSDLQRLSVSDDAKDELAAAQVAVSEVTTAWSAYRDFATTMSADDVDALPLMEDAAETWTVYAESRAALEEALLPALER